MPVIGLKSLRQDYTSLSDKYGRVRYSPGEYVTVPGNGAYAAHPRGLWSSIWGANYSLAAVRYVAVACVDEVPVAALPDGVRCWRRVKVLGRASAEQLAAAVLASPEDALLAGQYLAHDVPAEVWGKVAQDYPENTLCLAVRWFSNVVSPSIWADIVERFPRLSLWQASRDLARVVPAEGWTRAARKEPYMALEMACEHLCEIVSAAAWTEIVTEHPVTAAGLARYYLSKVVLQTVWDDLDKKMRT